MPQNASRRSFLLQASSAGWLLGAPGLRAQPQADWPRQPVRMIVPYAAGGSMDAVARLIGKTVAPRLGQPIIVDNRGGAGGIPGTDAIAKAAPDGYTFGAGALTSLVSNQILHEKLPYDVDRELAFVSLVATVPLVLCVHPSLPVSSAPELLQHLKRNKGRYSYGSYGAGNYGHLAAMHISESQNADMVHAPYRGEAPMLQDLLGGQVQMAFGSPVAVRPHIESGRFKALAVTGAQRITVLPNVPTLVEQGLNDPIYHMNPGWVGVIAPQKTPAAIQQRMAAEIVAVMKEPEVREQIVGMGFTPVGSTPEKFHEAYRAEFPMWRKLIQQAGVKAQS